MSASRASPRDFAAASEASRSGRHAEAVGLLRGLAARFPEDAEVHRQLGDALLAAGAKNEAAAAFVEAVRRDRACAGAHAGLARIFDERGDVVAAMAAFQQVVRLSPNDPRALSRLGQILTMFRVTEAEAYLRRAIELEPGDTEAARHLGYVLRRLNRVEEARNVARGILARNPDDLQASLVLRLALSPVPASKEAAAAERERFASGIAELAARVDRFAADPAQLLLLKWENFILAYQGQDDRPLQEAFARFITAIGQRCAPGYFAPRPKRRLAPGERIRVGILSGFLHDCTAGKYFRSWITDLYRSRFEVFAYYTGFLKDAFNASLAQSVEHYRHLFEPAPNVARAVLADGLDVLVYPEVGMETTGNLLACMRLAPVQCAGWGHPVTTGRPSIDYFLTCGEMEPEGAQSHYSETLVRLPGLGTRYERPVVEGERSRAQLGLPEGRHLYLCPQSAFKIHPDNDGLFAAILAADPDATLVFFRDYDEPLTEAYRNRLARAFAPAGLDLASRTIFLPRASHADYLHVNRLCDAFLDTLHWSGGNTTLDALAAGLPPVTLPGPTMRGRQSFAMLRLLGLEELVAADAADYVRIATRLGADPGHRREVSGKILDRADRLFGRGEPVQALQAFLEGVVERVGR
jgi:CRISPR-associated protein Csy1